MFVSGSIPSGELRWFSVNEVAARLGVAPDTGYRRIAGEGLPAHRAGRPCKCTLPEVDEGVRGGGNWSGAHKECGGGSRIPPVTGKAAVLRWSGEAPARNWMNFYTKVLSRFATIKSPRLTVAVDVAPDGVSKQAVEETRTALRELGLKDDLL